MRGEALAVQSEPESVTALVTRDTGAVRACFHCGEPCAEAGVNSEGKSFCCQGCRVVHDLLRQSGLGHFYDLSRAPGVRVGDASKRDRWTYLDDPAIQRQLLDFTDGKLSRVTFRIPAIHCVACVWLLENLFQLNPGIGRSQVNFPRREATIFFSSEQVKLSELLALLASIGYAPSLTLGELEHRSVSSFRQRQWLQVGVAGFGFGNIMLLSLPQYLGLDSFSGSLFRAVFGWLGLALALPVVTYSAADYWKSAWLAVRQRGLTLEVPIVLGLGALYLRSAYEIGAGRGFGYLDSLAGLVFFLLCGRVFQQRTHERLAFDRDYKSLFPLSVARKRSAAPGGEEQVSLLQLGVGDHICIRNGELIPADSILIHGSGFIDYSFVTGESAPVAKAAGDYVYAGGQQIGGVLELEVVKAVSQSYLTSLWNHEAFQKQRGEGLDTLTNRYSRWFTWIVIAVALGAAGFWVACGDAARALQAFASVLIVACPCALALAAPFTFGTAQRLLSRIGVFLKNALVLERMARIDAIVFDKTGTLTAASAATVEFHSPVGPLTAEEASWVRAVTRQSTHPYSVRIHAALGAPASSEAVGSFREVPGGGMAGQVRGHEIRLGSRAWLEQNGARLPTPALPAGSEVCLTLDGQFRGVFVLSNALRPEAERLVQKLAARHELALLSGDNERERERFRGLFGPGARLHFNQSPLEKLGFIRSLQAAGRTVMMVGDGLNDAGALKQSDVGVAVVEQAGAFSPASDVILESSRIARLSEMLALARRAVTVVRLSFGISALYNVLGVSIAAAGRLSPVICAILMPLSSVSVVLFACAAVTWAARRTGVFLDVGQTSREMTHFQPTALSIIDKA